MLNSIWDCVSGISLGKNVSVKYGLERGSLIPFFTIALFFLAKHALFESLAWCIWIYTKKLGDFPLIV